MFKEKYLLTMMLGLGLNAVSNPLMASEPASRSLEEVMVTARRSSENLQSIPVTVKAFNSQSLQEKSISTPEDIQLNTPGVFLSGTGSRQNVIYQIRGQSKSVFGPNSPAVVSYFAEVPDPFVGSFVPQYDMASVQVLKGPQGTLFGRNTTGGAILYSPELPTYETNGYVKVVAGEYDKKEIQGAVTVPIIDNTLAVRIAVDSDKRDPVTENIGVGGDIDNIDSYSYRVSVLYEPLENLTNTTIYDYYKSNSGGTAQIIGNVRSDYNLLTQLGLQTAALAQAENQQAWGPHKTISAVDYSNDNNERSSFINRTEYALDGIELVNIFGYRKTELSIAVNTDGMSLLTSDGSGAFPAGYPVAYIKAGLNDAVKQISDEFQIKGQFGDGKSDWLLGFFWLQSEPDGAQGSSVAFAQIPGAAVVGPSYNFIEEESKAVYANVSLDIDSWLQDATLDMSVRYTMDDTESCTAKGINTQAGPLVADSSLVSQADCQQGNNVASASVNTTSAEELTWSIGLNWQMTDDLFSYIVSRHGYRAGGVNSPTFSGRLTEFQTFEPETVTDIEWGLRADWLVAGVNVRSNLSAFIGRYSDVQSTLSGVQTSGICDPNNSNNPAGISPDGDCDRSNDPNGGSILLNVGDSQVSGIDFDVHVAVTDNLMLTLGGNYLDMSTRKYALPAAFAPYSSEDQINFNLAAQKSAIAGIRYEINNLDFAESVVMNFDYYWTDKAPYGTASLPGYSVSNLRVDVNNVMGQPLDLSLVGRNIFDKEYANSASASGDFIGMTSLVYGAPRIYAVELRYNF